MPALTYIRTQLTDDEQDRLWGNLVLFAQPGPPALNSNVFIPFKGEDHKDGMAEFRVGDSLGHRILGFRMRETVTVRLPAPKDEPGISVRERKRREEEARKPHVARVEATRQVEVPLMLLTHGYTKPAQPETPPEEKRTAREIRDAHIARQRRLRNETQRRNPA